MLPAMQSQTATAAGNNLMHLIITIKAVVKAVLKEKCPDALGSKLSSRELESSACQGKPDSRDWWVPAPAMQVKCSSGKA